VPNSTLLYNYNLQLQNQPQQVPTASMPHPFALLDRHFPPLSVSPPSDHFSAGSCQQQSRVFQRVADLKAPEESPLLLLVAVHPLQDVVQRRCGGHDVGPLVEHDALGTLPHGRVRDLCPARQAQLGQPLQYLPSGQHANHLNRQGWSHRSKRRSVRPKAACAISTADHQAKQRSTSHLPGFSASKARQVEARLLHKAEHAPTPTQQPCGPHPGVEADLCGPDDGHMGGLTQPQNLLLDLGKPLPPNLHCKVAPRNHDANGIRSLHASQEQPGQLLERTLRLNLRREAPHHSADNPDTEDLVTRASARLETACSLTPVLFNIMLSPRIDPTITTRRL
jgi:hypothetical protein